MNKDTKERLLREYTTKECQDFLLLHPPKCDVKDFNGKQCSNPGVHDVGNNNCLCTYHYNELLQIIARQKAEEKERKRWAIYKI